MTQLLHIDSSILGANSVSRALSASVVAKLVGANPGLKITYRDLAASSVPHLTAASLMAAQASAEPEDAALRADVALGRAVLDELLTADVVVLGLGFYNFGVPSQLKAWVDRIAIAGKTFRYTEKGPVGLAGGKRVILAIARGGFYGPGTASASFEHAETYLKNIFSFIGISQVEVVTAEGVAAGPELRQAGIEKAQTAIEALAA